MRAFLLFSAASVAAFFTGCSTPATPQAAPSATSLDPSVNPRSIAKGMMGEEVIRRIGKPAEVQPINSSNGHAEVWIYRREAGQKTVQSATGTRQIPVPDMATGGTRMVDEPVYSIEQINFEEEISLLMFDGKLVEWKKSVAGKRAFN